MDSDTLHQIFGGYINSNLRYIPPTFHKTIRGLCLEIAKWSYTLGHDDKLLNDKTYQKRTDDFERDIEGP